MGSNQGQKILLATLGEFPVVVSATANLLVRQGTVLDKVQIIYPKETNERWIEIGYEFLEEYFLQNTAIVTEPVELPFADANSYEHSLAFLRRMCDELEAHEHMGNTVYLSLSGGRKHTSALMAALPQFYACVSGFYHLHDTREHHPGQQFSTRQLEQMSPEERCRRLAVPTQKHIEDQRFTLIELPYQSLASGNLLRQWVQHADSHDMSHPIPVSPQALSFFEDLFQPTRDSTRLELWLTQTAYDQYCKLLRTDATRIRNINTYLDTMIKARWLKDNIHHFEHDQHKEHTQHGSQDRLIHYVCRRHINPGIERPFFYTQPYPIGLYEQQKNKPVAVNRLIITRLSYHINGTDYDKKLVDWVKDPDVEPRYRLNDLPKRPMILIAPLGESPMIVTQMYRLLQEREHATIEAIYVLFPAGHPPSQNGADMLHHVCEKRSIRLHRVPLDIADVYSTETSATFSIGLMAVIQDAQRTYPAASLALSLSGGRKGMSAMAFYAAQHEGIVQVYHTTIRDPDVERDIDRQYERVRYQPADVQAAFLFLDTWSSADFDLTFDLIRVPVITLLPQ